MNEFCGTFISKMVSDIACPDKIRKGQKCTKINIFGDKS